MLFLRIVIQGHSILLGDALHALRTLYHKRTSPSIDGECRVECLLVVKQYCSRRKAVLLLPLADSDAENGGRAWKPKTPNLRFRWGGVLAEGPQIPVVLYACVCVWRAALSV